MKRFILLFITLLFSLAPSRTPRAITAHAEEESYAVARTASVWLYASEEENSKLFCIPRTYYVKVLKRGTPYSAVEYLTDSEPYRKVVGYCKTDALTFVSFLPERPFLYREITVEYVLPGAALGNGSFSEKSETYVYYGTRYENGQLYFYVGKDGVFDYIPADGELTYELNYDYLEEEKTSQTDKSDKTNQSAAGLSAAEIIVIVLSALSLAVVVVLLLRKRRSSSEEP